MNAFGIAIIVMGVSFSVQASDPDFARHLNRIEQLLSDDELTEAASIAKALVADNDEQAALHQRLLGYIYLSEGNYDRAYLAYTNALNYKKLPESLRQDTLGALVSLSMKRGKPEVAIQYSRMYLNEFPPYQPVQQLYARALFSSKSYAGALEQANAVIAGYSDIPEFIWQIKAISEEQLGLNRALINTTRVLQQRYGDDARWQRKEASALARIGSYRKALAIMESLVASDAQLQESDYLDAAQYAAYIRDPDAAVVWLEKGIKAETVAPSRWSVPKCWNTKCRLHVGQMHGSLQQSSTSNPKYRCLKHNARLHLIYKSGMPPLCFLNRPLIWAVKTTHFYGKSSAMQP
ncbi:tetratricopeptide repeat protein [Enterovibrio coralii]|uniref:tetratricopeptide repeat protein n=1 Tax=Enterovibrio coralii TaxID=294935 RepID=UPI000ABC85B6|nr:hypothetical protein [Enterovibrio coralii]